MNQATVQMCICINDLLDVEDRLQGQQGHETDGDTGEGATPSERSTRIDEKIN